MGASYDGYKNNTFGAVGLHVDPSHWQYVNAVEFRTSCADCNKKLIRVSGTGLTTGHHDAMAQHTALTAAPSSQI